LSGESRTKKQRELLHAVFSSRRLKVDLVQRIKPIVDVLAHAVLGNTIAFLKLTFELISLSVGADGSNDREEPDLSRSVDPGIGETRQGDASSTSNKIRATSKVVKVVAISNLDNRRRSPARVVASRVVASRVAARIGKPI
jgi:hypothetical protein